MRAVDESAYAKRNADSENKTRLLNLREAKATGYRIEYCAAEPSRYCTAGRIASSIGICHAAWGWYVSDRFAC